MAPKHSEPRFHSEGEFVKCERAFKTKTRAPSLLSYDQYTLTMYEGIV